MHTARQGATIECIDWTKDRVGSKASVQCVERRENGEGGEL